MTEFRCGRFPSGVVPISTDAGIVDFHDGTAEVDDPELAEALHRVPAIFEIRQMATFEEAFRAVAPEPEPEATPAAAALREWAKANDIPCPAKGRVPQTVVRAYLTRRAEQE
jgi:hypothetical protein